MDITTTNNNNNTLYQQAFRSPSDSLLNELSPTNKTSVFDMAYNLDLSPEAQAALAQNKTDNNAPFNSTMAFLSAINDSENLGDNDPFSASLQTTADLLSILNGTKKV